MIMDDVNVVNPAVPSTVGALLAEEWTINPLATLPSFLEMFMMDEASRSAQKSLDAAMDVLRQKLAAVNTAATDDRAGSNSSQPQQTSSTASTTSIIGTSSSVIFYLRSFLQRSAGKFASSVAHLLQNYGPEISCLILYTMERHCLRSQACATISESLYGGRLAKVDLSSNNNNNATKGNENQERKLLPLNDRDKTRLALLVALGPYVRVRLLQLYKKIKQDTETQQEQQSTAGESAATGFSQLSLLQKLQKLYAFAYPMLHVSLSSLDMMYQWRYLLGHSVFFHPYSHFLGLVVRRVTQEDTPESQNKGNNSTATSTTSSSTDAAAGANSIASTALPSAPPSLASSLLQPSDTLRNAAVVVLSSAVVLSWVAQFRSEYRRQRQELIHQQQQEQERQQQQQEENTNPSEANNLNTNANRMVMIQNSKVPPPPTSGIKNSNALPPHLCPLCRRERMHPTASTSGFVFCYKCLLQSVQETGKCPVTGRDCREEQLIRLYEPNAATNNGG